jgi:uncharacterized protein YgfB (UPF0149 family)
MSETANVEIKVALPNKKEVVFASGHSLKQWTESFLREWSWLEHTPARRTWERIQSRIQNTRDQTSRWGQSPQHEETVHKTKAVIESAIEQIRSDTKGVLWDEVSMAAITKAKGMDANLAAGLLTSLIGGEVYFESTLPESYFAGLIRGFLFKNEIDWTASAHHKVLEELETQYRQRLEDQEARLQRLEIENQRLNADHGATLKAKSDGLDELNSSKASALDGLHTAKETALNDLYAAKDKAFADLASKHEANLKAIEDTFHNKLALQKPIDYWRDKKSAHVKLAKRFAGASAIVLILFGIGLGFLIHWAFGSLAPNENPKHWQVGVTIIAAFFVIWIVRLLVRMFLSHQHLAADAAERVTMVQTYLSLSREGQGVAPADRSVILQQIFKSASDGLVKDDGAPPTALEWFSRPK